MDQERGIVAAQANYLLSRLLPANNSEFLMVLPRVVTNPKIMTGKPVIAGTRITVELLLEKLASGETAEQILRAYPHLPEGSIQAALTYAAAVVRNELVFSLERRSA